MRATASSEAGAMWSGSECGRREKAASPRIVAIGGGTGLPVVLDGLCGYASETGHPGNLDLTAVVTVTDDGGSSGRLRRQLGVLPPGDVRNCLVALAHQDSPFKHLLQHRFAGPTAAEGHPVGNLLLSALAQVTGDFSEAIDQLGALLGTRGQVLPTTTESVGLRAELESGELVSGETEIVGRPSPIRRLSLQPSPRPTPSVLRALVNADAIVVGPGSLHTSLLPNLLVEGIAATIYAVNAVRIYVANLMTEPGETDGYTLDDHLRAIRTHTGFDLFDYILVNRQPIDDEVVARYAERGSQPVSANEPLRWGGGATVVECDLAIEWGGLKIRHDPRSLARVLRRLVSAGRPAPAQVA